MLDPTGNTPTVTRARLVRFGADEHADAALDQVAGLLVRMGVPGAQAMGVAVARRRMMESARQARKRSLKAWPEPGGRTRAWPARALASRTAICTARLTRRSP